MGPSLILLPKRARSHTKQRGFNRAWLKYFPWVLDVEGEGMLCRLCRKHARRPQKAVIGKTTWVDVPCVTMTQKSLTRHDTSLSHLDAKKLEAQLCLSKKYGGVQQTLTAVESAERKAMKAMLLLKSGPTSRRDAYMTEETRPLICSTGHHHNYITYHLGCSTVSSLIFIYNKYKLIHVSQYFAVYCGIMV